MDTDTIYNDLHIFKITPAAPKALLPQEGWRLAEGRVPGGAGSSGDQPGKKWGRTQLVGSLGRVAATPVTRWGGRRSVFLGEACLTPWGKGGQPAREDKSILAKPVSVSAPPGAQALPSQPVFGRYPGKGLLSGQANSTSPIPTPSLPSPVPEVGSVQLPAPSDSPATALSPLAGDSSSCSSPEP